MITLTDTAAVKVKELLEAEGDPDLALRVAVRPGGCSGFSYEMFFDGDVAADDEKATFGTPTQPSTSSSTRRRRRCSRAPRSTTRTASIRPASRSPTPTPAAPAVAGPASADQAGSGEERVEPLVELALVPDRRRCGPSRRRPCDQIEHRLVLQAERVDGRRHRGGSVVGVDVGMHHHDRVAEPLVGLDQELETPARTCPSGSAPACRSCTRPACPKQCLGQRHVVQRARVRRQRAIRLDAAVVVDGRRVERRQRRADVRHGHLGRVGDAGTRRRIRRRRRGAACTMPGWSICTLIAQYGITRSVE